ncbi:MAG: VWA domain-containing protein [Vicinamibacteria bacterium]|nr:VWA domain-containing protein [Vicinamibacteria bacterium]
MASRLIAPLWLVVLQPIQEPPALVIRPAVARMVIVDAFVKDRGGRPIGDLRAGDFELREDGKVIPIAAFLSPASRNPGAAANAPGPVTAGGASASAEPEATTLVIFPDRHLLSPGGRKRALDQAWKLSEGLMARGARAVVVSEDKGLRPLTPLTSDPQAVHEAIAEIQGWATGSAAAADTRDALDDIKAMIESNASSGCDCVCALQQLIQRVRAYAGLRAMEAREASDRLTQVVNSFLGVPGRKSLLYVSEGLERQPGLQLYDQLGAICPAAARQLGSPDAAAQEFDTSEPLRAVVARANAARVSIYPIDGGGLRPSSIADISQADRRYVPSAGNDILRETNLRAPLNLLGEETGGFALLNGLDAGTAMRYFAADEQGHYIVGFIPGEADGKVHRLRVRLTAEAGARRHAEIRHRQSYLRAELPARRGQRALATLIFGLEENALGAEASLDRTDPSRAHLVLSLPWKALEGSLDSEKSAHLQVVMSFRQSGDEKSPITTREQEVALKLSGRGVTGEGERRELAIDVPVQPGRYDFAIGLENPVSGSASYLRRTLSDTVSRVRFEALPSAVAPVAGEETYWAQAARFADGEGAGALAALSTFDDKSFEAIADSAAQLAKEAQKCSACEARSRFEALPLKAAVLLQSGQDRKARILRASIGGGQPDCEGEAARTQGDALLGLALLQSGGPDFVAGYSVALAVHYRALFCLVEAERAVERGLKAKPLDPILLLVSGMVHETLGVLGAAPRFMAMAPALADPFLRDAAIARQRQTQFEASHRKDLTQARKDLLSALEQDPSLSAARLRQGRIEWRLGNPEAARDALKQVVADHDPSTLFLSHLFLGAALEDLGSLDEAVAECEVAVASKPGAQVAGIALAHAFSMRGETSRARELLAPLLSPGQKTQVNYYWDYLVGTPVMAEARFEDLRRELAR